MKLLKIYFALVIILSISYGGVYMSTRQQAESYEMGEVVPYEKWMNTLVGKWKINFSVRQPLSLLDVQGVTTYYEDSSYYDIFEYKYYGWHKNKYPLYRDINPIEEDLNKAGKLIRKGTVDPEDNLWGRFLIRINDECYKDEHYQDIVKFDACREVYSLVSLIGNYDSRIGSGHNSKLLSFNKNSIKVVINDGKLSKPLLVTYTKLEEN